MANEDLKNSEANKISKMQEDNARLKYRIKILERALEEDENSRSKSQNKE